MCEHVVFVYFSCTNYWISLCLKSAKIARKLMKANVRNSFANQPTLPRRHESLGKISLLNQAEKADR